MNIVSTFVETMVIDIMTSTGFPVNRVEFLQNWKPWLGWEQWDVFWKPCIVQEPWKEQCCLTLMLDFVMFLESVNGKNIPITNPAAPWFLFLCHMNLCSLRILILLSYFRQMGHFLKTLWNQSMCFQKFPPPASLKPFPQLTPFKIFLQWLVVTWK